jgi:hypothetical protein
VTSSLWASANKNFALNESGDTAIIKAGDEFEFAGTNSIEGLFWSTPSATESTLLVRGAGKLHCIANE